LPDGQEEADNFPALKNQVFYNLHEVSDNNMPSSGSEEEEEDIETTQPTAKRRRK
jgi:hypothetical protein